MYLFPIESGQKAPDSNLKTGLNQSCLSCTGFNDQVFKIAWYHATKQDWFAPNLKSRQSGFSFVKKYV
jgi:hypothetical protein